MLLTTRHLQKADELFGAECEDAHWERTVCRQFVCSNLDFQRRFGELDAEVGRFLTEAQQRGDHFTRAVLTPLGAALSITYAGDDPEGARALLAEAMRPWPRNQIYLQHFFEWIAHARIDMYVRNPDMSERLHRGFERLGKTLLGRSPIMKGYLDAFDGQALLLRARVLQGQERRALLARAARGHRALLRTNNPQNHVIVWSQRPQISLLSGDLDEARQLLHEAIDALAGLNRDTSPQEYMLGKLTGGDEGRALMERALSHLRQLGARNPERVMASEGGDLVE